RHVGRRCGDDEGAAHGEGRDPSVGSRSRPVMLAVDLSTLGEGGVGRKLVVTAVLLAIVIGFRAIVTALLRRTRPVDAHESVAERRRFWIRQGSKLIALALLVGGLAV